MEGTYPVIVDEKLIGQLTVSKKGLLTLFQVQCDHQEGLIRLSVYGLDHQEGYLGVLSPNGSGGLALKKALTRRDLEQFPNQIDHCGRAGESWIEETVQKEEVSPQAMSLGEEDSVAEGDVLWHPAPGGVLVTSHAGQNLVALPAEREGLPLDKALETREIDGVRYAIFSVKNGNFI